MAEESADRVASLGEHGERLLGAAARGLLSSPLLGDALGRALAARSKAAQAQEAAIGLLGVPSAGDVERLNRRVRSLSERLAGVEDSLARIESTLRRQADQAESRTANIERQLAALTRAVEDLEAARSEEPLSVSRDQETLRTSA
jgi:predicted  nucleic acid-binding Zn-ribbon protein